MGFQTSVRYDYAFGVPGEIKFDGPSRVQPGFINSASAAYNIVGATIFTQPVAGGAVVAGGAIGPGSGNVFFGLLVNPKLYASFGTTSGGPLDPTLTLPNNVEAEFMLTGYVVVSVPAACHIGDLLTYNLVTGALATVSPQASFTGVIAVTTGILTVTARAADATIVPGALALAGTSVPAGTVITAQLSSTEAGGALGGNGTYQTNIVTAVASTAMTAPNSAPSGSGLVPNSVIDKFQQTASGGLALARMLN
jgi:hypothetical protein